MAAHDLWYKNAILYCLDVEKYMDANGDGTGDFEGLHRRLEYLAGLGVTCLWLPVGSSSTSSTRTTAAPRAACTSSRCRRTVIAGIAWGLRTTR